MVLVVMGSRVVGNWQSEKRENQNLGGKGRQLSKGTGASGAGDPGAVSDIRITLSLIWAVKVGSDRPKISLGISCSDVLESCTC